MNDGRRRSWRASAAHRARFGASGLLLVTLAACARSFVIGPDGGPDGGLDGATPPDAERDARAIEDGPTSPPGPTDPDAFMEAFARARCSAIAYCGDPSYRPSPGLAPGRCPPGALLGYGTDELRRSADAVREGRLRIDPVAAGRCLEEAASRCPFSSYEGYVGGGRGQYLLAACRGVFVPARAPTPLGAVCSTDAECGMDAYCHGDSWCETGECRRRPRLGEPCAGVCEIGDGPRVECMLNRSTGEATCMRLADVRGVAEGGPCYWVQERGEIEFRTCAVGLGCLCQRYERPGICETFACERLPSLGEACPSGLCALGLRCAEGRCVEEAIVEEEGGACEPRLWEDACSRERRLICGPTGTCERMHGGEGSPCWGLEFDYLPCGADFYCDAEETRRHGSPGTCRRRLRVGEPCDRDTSCATGHCQDGRCSVSACR